jgi:hypothetical protein
MLSLADLQTPDERTLRFLPLGLGTGHKLRPESAAEFQQKAVDVALVEAVPEQVRDSFDRVRMLHSYGVLSYELFTAAHDLTRLILEQALRARFIEYYDGTIPLVAKDGAPFPLAATTFDVVYDTLNGGSHRKAQRLVVGDGPETIDFRGSLNHLLSWARAHGLLAGQRNRLLEPVFVEMRNDVAHPSHDHLVMPVHSAQAIRDLGEIINRLWGATTPGGRLYPGPLRRDVVIIGWSADGESLVRMSAAQLPEPSHPDIVDYVVVRAVADDANLWDFDARRETTHCPSEYLWGPGRHSEALEWVQAAQPQPDEAECLDQLFLIREHGDTIGGPYRPEACAACDKTERGGTWHLVVADHPWDAVNHVRSLAGGNLDCADSGPCPGCPAESRISGAWSDVLSAYQRAVGGIRNEPPPDVRVPGRFSRAVV